MRSNAQPFSNAVVGTATADSLRLPADRSLTMSRMLRPQFGSSARRNQRKGAVLFLVAVLMVFFVVTSAFAINVAYMQLVDTELRCATDCAARAGGEGLARGLTMEQATEEIKQLAALNRVDGTPLVIRNEDIVFGHAIFQDGQRYSFQTNDPASVHPVNAVRVGGHRVNGGDSNAINLPFTAFLDRTTFEASKFATAAIQERDIVLVVDRSGSMGSDDGGVSPVSTEDLSRMEALQYSVSIFRNVLNQTDGNEKLGLVSYADTSRIDTRLSHDYSSFDQKMSEMPTSGYTNIGDGIDDAADVVLETGKARPAATPVIVVMTDGIHNRERDPEQAATDAMARDPRLQIYTVTFSSGADQSRMQRVATIGNGVHYHAADFSQLADVFADIARTAGAILIE